MQHGLTKAHDMVPQSCKLKMLKSVEVATNAREQFQKNMEKWRTVLFSVINKLVSKSVITENAECVVATCQSNVLLIWCVICEIKYWYKNNRVRNNDIKSRKNLVCFQIYKTDVYGGGGSYTVYRDVLESKQFGRTFKLVMLKHEDQVSVRNESLSLNLLVAELKYVCLFMFNLTNIFM